MVTKKLARIVVLLAIALGAAFSAAVAQGQGAPAAPAAAAAAGSGADLPVEGPVEGVEEPVEPVEEPGPTFFGEPIPTRGESLIYVIDQSGSMGWDTMIFTGLDGNPQVGNRLDRAKVELIRSIQTLPESFVFNIIAYDCEMRRWAPARQLATPAAKASAIGWVNGLRPGGATGTGPAVALALQERDNRTVVLLSDGDPNCPYDDDWIPNHLQCILSANQQGAAVHCFGINAYGAFEQFLRDVATRTGGVYHAIQ